MRARIPENEPQRLAALHRYNILDTLPELEFDDLTRLASSICGTPVSALTLIDENRQWLKSKVGLDVEETPRDLAFCAHTILDTRLTMVSDAQQDARFADNPLVMDAPNIRFYAGTPLITSDDYALGALCVVDVVPRTLTPEQQEALQALGRQAVRQIEMRLSVQRMAGLVEQRERAEQELQKAHDSLERKVQERTQALAFAKNEAEAASRAKSQFLATMSHELRTPLNHILGYSEMLIEEAEESEQASLLPDLKKIQASGKSLLQLVDTVLDLSRADAGDLELALEEFSVAPLIQSLAETMQPLMQKKGNLLRIHCADDIGVMHADLSKVRQCLLNLLSNAHKFTEGSEIRLSVEPEAQGGEEGIRFVVEDKGIGISPDQIGRIFEPFTQADGGATRKQDGSGLGLAITLRYCQMMGGEILVESEPGRGSTFTLRLPMRCEFKTTQPTES